MLFLRRLWFWKLIFYAMGKSFIDVIKCRDAGEIPQIYGRGDKSLLKRITAYRPKRWLANPWTQMLFTHTLRKPISFERHELTLNDGAKITLDMVSPPCLTSSPFEVLSLAASPLILICPGLGSNSDNDVITRICHEAVSRRWRPVVYNRRGHSTGTATINFPQHAQLYDMEVVVKYLTELFPFAPKILVGISCGANLAVKYIGSPSHPNPFLGALSVSNGFNIDRATLSFSPIVHSIMLEWLRNLYWQHKDMLMSSNVNLNFNLIESTQDAREFERELILPLYGFRTLEDYYESQSCYNCLGNIRIPLLVLHSKDDPIVNLNLAEYAVASTNPFVSTLLTKRGGHASWMERRGESWLVNVIMTYTENLLEAQQCQALKKLYSLQKLKKQQRQHAVLHPLSQQLQASLQELSKQ